VRRLLEKICAARSENQVCALLGEHARDFEPDAGRGAGYDRDVVFENGFSHRRRR
jgi:hypothetical protein